MYSGINGVKMHSWVTRKPPCAVRMTGPATRHGGTRRGQYHPAGDGATPDRPAAPGRAPSAPHLFLRRRTDMQFYLRNTHTKPCYRRMYLTNDLVEYGKWLSDRFSAARQRSSLGRSGGGSPPSRSSRWRMRIARFLTGRRFGTTRPHAWSAPMTWGGLAFHNFLLRQKKRLPGRSRGAVPLRTVAVAWSGQSALTRDGAAMHRDRPAGGRECQRPPAAARALHLRRPLLRRRSSWHDR